MEEEKKKLSKKAKKRIGCLIPLGIIVLTVGFMFAWNAGLGLPWGYKKYTEGRVNFYPINSNDKGKSVSLRNQFEDENPNHISNSVNFLYDKERYCLITDNEYFAYPNSEMSVYKTDSSNLIGTFIKKENPSEGYDYYQSYLCIFFDDHYLYYLNQERIERLTFYVPLIHMGHPNKTRLYYKYEFYRLDLDTGTNEKIKIDLFVEKINVFYTGFHKT